MTQTLKTLIPLAIVFALLVATNFIYAAWTAPSGAPSAGNNALAPINVGSDDQVKNAGLFLNSLAVTGNALIQSEVHSPSYCDENGANCFNAASSSSSGVGIGYDQTWQEIVRLQGVWYQNTTSKPIMVFHKNIWNGTNISVGATQASAIDMNFKDYDSDLDNGSTLIIPPGHYYRMNTFTGNTANNYYDYRELR